MGKLSREEKKELIDLANSSKLKKDFQMLKKDQKTVSHNNEFSKDDYIEFLDFSNKLIAHKQKPFKKIKGNKFKL